MTKRIGNVALGRRPLVVGGVFGKHAGKMALEAKRCGADLLEIRLDLSEKISSDYFTGLVKKVKQTVSLPLMAVLRLKEEGGSPAFTRKTNRIEYFRLQLPFVDAVDIEIQSREFKSVANLAKKAKKTVIGSYHNLKRTPDTQTLTRILKQAKSCGAGVVKIACYNKTREDAIRLLQFNHKYKNHLVAVMGMGKEGMFTRMVAPFFGSVLCYGYTAKPLAHGQFHVKTLVQTLKLLKV